MLTSKGERLGSVRQRLVSLVPRPARFISSANIEHVYKFFAQSYTTK